MSQAELKELQQALMDAVDYNQWLHTASKIDQLTGAYQWRAEIEEGDNIYTLLRAHITTIKHYQASDAWQALIEFIPESLHRTIAELNNVRLYQVALSGPKFVIDEYFTVVESALNLFCETNVLGLSQAEKLKMFQAAERNFGRPALMLSGGGTFGIYHFGVIKALLEQELLPEVISGTSMGSIAAGVVAKNTDQELKEILASPYSTHHTPLKTQSFREVLSSLSLLDPNQLLECVQANMGDTTFQEAFEKTGREVSITVSSSRSSQKPRVLNHLTAPNVLMSYASKASCSVPGLFPACVLKAKKADDQIVDYMSDERWFDGSFASDIPRQRISRLHNVNYFIVSQANPHILPFVSQRQKHGKKAVIKDLVVSSVLGQGRSLLKVAKRRLYRQPWQSWLDHASILLEQDYLGDINIHPDFSLDWYMKFMKNPTHKELDELIMIGERATWPSIQMINNQTRISKTLRRCIKLLS